MRDAAIPKSDIDEKMSQVVKFVHCKNHIRKTLAFVHMTITSFIPAKNVHFYLGRLPLSRDLQQRPGYLDNQGTNFNLKLTHFQFATVFITVVLKRKVGFILISSLRLKM